MNLTDRGRLARERLSSPISHRLSVLLIRPTLSQPRPRLRLAFDIVGQTRPGVAFGSRQPVEARHLPAKPALNKGLDIENQLRAGRGEREGSAMPQRSYRLLVRPRPDGGRHRSTDFPGHDDCADP